MQVLALTAILVGVLHWSSSCEIKAKGVSEADKKAILKIHNELRAKIANGNEKEFPTAANMLELEWDDHLAKQAQAWAEKCEFEHDDPIDKDGEQAGQNIGWEGKPDDKPEWEEMIQSFYDEVKDFKPSDIHKYIDDDDTGHFTQVIWAKSSRVGCGYIRYVGEDGGNEFLYGCNYSPGGNVEDRPIYEVGTPCSKCGGCGSIPGLCKSK